MAKEVIGVAGISEALEQANVPLSPAVKANGFVFVSGCHPSTARPVKSFAAISSSRPNL